MCTWYLVRTHSAPSSRVVKAPWLQKTKVRNTSNTHSHEHTRSSTHPPTSSTHPPTQPPTDAPTYQPTTCYSNTAEYSSRCVDTSRVTVSYTGISIFERFPAIPGSERSVPGRPTYTAPRSPSRARHPLFAGDREGLLCGGVRGTIARPQEAEWSSRLAAVFWVL